MNKQNDSKLKRQWKTNLYFIMKVIQLSKLQVFNRGHSAWIDPSAVSDAIFVAGQTRQNI